MALLNNLVALATPKKIFRGAVLLAFIVLCLTHMCSAQDSKPSKTSTDAVTTESWTALRCAVDTQEPGQLYFADPDGKNIWREYRSEKDVPGTETFAQFGQFWLGRDGKILIRVEQPTEDWSTRTDYCFNKMGRLIAVQFEVRTAWGWGYREEGPVTKDRLAPQMSEFFTTRDDARIARPEMADEVPDALKPHFYLRMSRLPFAKFLHSRPH